MEKGKEEGTEEYFVRLDVKRRTSVAQGPVLASPILTCFATVARFQFSDQKTKVVDVTLVRLDSSDFCAVHTFR